MKNYRPEVSQIACRALLWKAFAHLDNQTALLSMELQREAGPYRQMAASYAHVAEALFQRLVALEQCASEFQGAGPGRETETMILGRFQRLIDELYRGVVMPLQELSMGPEAGARERFARAAKVASNIARKSRMLHETASALVEGLDT